jgi:hypothetical protein
MAVWTTYIIALSDIAGKNNHSRNVRRGILQHISLSAKISKYYKRGME